MRDDERPSTLVSCRASHGPTMGITVTAGDVEADRERVVELFARHINPAYNTRRFDWLYRRNPHGLGRLWLAVDPATDSLVGAAGALPRRVYVAGREELAWVLADFCVSDRYRVLGPALTLYRACFAALGPESPVLCHDFPSQGS